jgi:SAM-dependent methyltransferase
MIQTLRKFARQVVGSSRHSTGIPYWEKRARQYGARSVLNINHTEEEATAVTEMQITEIFPHLRQQLNGSERLILDYGCGPGRFTRELANLICGEAIGIDPIKTLIDLAPQAANVRYEVTRTGRIPLADSCVDVVWICLVIGAIEPEALTTTCQEIRRVLKPAGLLFLVEGTNEGEDASSHYKFRPISHYVEMFAPFVHLEHLHDYYDLGERISVLAGRKLN